MTDDAPLTEITERKHSGLRPWKPGQSGNLAGRPKGSRHKIGEGMAAAYVAEWDRSGAEGLTRLAKENFEAFARLGVAIGYFPKEINVDVSHSHFAETKSIVEAFRIATAVIKSDVTSLKKHLPLLELEHDGE